jgi:hypothetical protein
VRGIVLARRWQYPYHPTRASTVLPPCCCFDAPGRFDASSGAGAVGSVRREDDTVLFVVETQREFGLIELPRRERQWKTKRFLKMHLPLYSL